MQPGQARAEDLLLHRARPGRADTRCPRAASPSAARGLPRAEKPQRHRVPRSRLQGNARRGTNSEMGERGAGSAGRNHTYVEKGEAKEEVKACCYFFLLLFPFKADSYTMRER